MARTIRKAGVKQVPRAEIKDEYQLENDPRFCAGSSRRALACAPGAGFGWKISKRNNE
jgi:hypothetical protein